MQFKKPLFVHPADVKAAQEAIKDISGRISAEKKKVKLTRTADNADGATIEKEKQILGRIKGKLVTLSQRNPSAAMALLRELKIKYPNFPWEE